MFDCERCGACCSNISGAFWAKEMIADDGSCRYFDSATRLCTIYATRPLICSVDRMYERYYAANYSREEFYQLCHASCEELRAARAAREIRK